MDSFSDPAGSDPIVAAVMWLQGTLLGTIATTVAVIAVAAVGFGMLTGRTNWRYGASVVVGAFILFGATSIVGGMRSAIGQNDPASPFDQRITPPPQPLISDTMPNPPPPPSPPASDPYAGAAVPQR
jgi:type IV secretion system protein VirB2